MIIIKLTALTDFEQLVDWIKVCSPCTYRDVTYTEYAPINIEVRDDIVHQIAERFSFKTCNDFPYYDRVRGEMVHKLFQYEQGWITSRRQLIITSEDCLSSIHMIPYKHLHMINVFQRSSNIEHALLDDLSFMCYMLRFIGRFGKQLTLNYTLSIPHSFSNQKSKVEQE